MSSISVASPTRLHRPAVSAGGQTRLRLTSRGRRVLAAFAAAPLVAALVVSGFVGGAAVATGEQVVTEFHTVTVMPGDTLWSLATFIAPHLDPRDVIDEIVRLNGLSGGTIVVGSELAIPTAYTQ